MTKQNNLGHAVSRQGIEPNPNPNPTSGMSDFFSLFSMADLQGHFGSFIAYLLPM